MKIKYNFNDLIKIKSVEAVDNDRPGIKIIKCCGNCVYAWFAHSNERRGFCRIGQMEKPPPNRDTPHRDWSHVHTHSTMLCDKHTFKPRARWINWVERWVNKKFNTNGEVIE